MRRKFWAGMIAAAIAIALGVIMWGGHDKAEALSSALNIRDGKVFSNATIVPWQPDPDLKPMGYYVLLDDGATGLARLASALSAKTGEGPMSSSPLHWKLPPGLSFPLWDDSYPGPGTPALYSERGGWTLWAKLQGERVFVVVISQA